MCFSVACLTDIKGLWSLLGEQVEHFLSIGDSVGNSKVFVSAAQLGTNIIQSNSLVAITLQEQNKEENKNYDKTWGEVSGCERWFKFLLASFGQDVHSFLLPNY